MKLYVDVMGRAEEIGKAFNNLSLTTGQATVAVERLGSASWHLPPREIFESEPEISEGCDYCGNRSDLRDRRGCCVACGGRR